MTDWRFLSLMAVALALCIGAMVFLPAILNEVFQ